ncbi:hypothetical protein GCM10017776_32790 [Streptomyces griseoluteus]|nr:hypothetical protein GCM10017776_32790 [Streptomyces griseoluteus]
MVLLFPVIVLLTVFVTLFVIWFTTEGGNPSLCASACAACRPIAAACCWEAPVRAACCAAAVPLATAAEAADEDVDAPEADPDDAH